MAQGPQQRKEEWLLLEGPNCCSWPVLVAHQVAWGSSSKQQRRQHQQAATAPIDQQ